MQKTERWQAVDGVDLLWQAWDDGEVVYHRGSGDTHLIDEAAADVLRALGRRPMDVGALASLVGPALDYPEADAEAYVRELLKELARLALVEPAP